MIASLRGLVVHAGVDRVVVEVGGVGLSVSCPPATAAALRPGERAELFTSLVVREDSLTLYGFAQADERDAFEIVQTVSGVGPRIAQAVLATLSPEALRQAVATENLTALVAVPGIGRKGAQRMVLELKDRLGAPSATAAAAVSDPGWEAAVRSGLESLGWTPREAQLAAQSVAPLAQEQDTPDIAVLLRAALRTLDRPGTSER